MDENKQSAPVIMVVDDCEDNRTLLKMVLGLYGYQVVEAANGLEAVETAQEIVPDLILMDLDMPVLNGFEAVELLREGFETRKVPIVAFTSTDTTEYRAKALSVGFDEYFTKPFDWLELRSLLWRFIRTA
jgi:CheY-like chemotaxis protein